MQNWIKTHLVICLLIAFGIGVIGASITIGIIASGRLGQLDTELAASRATIDRLTTIGSELTSENQHLAKLSADQLRGIAEASAIVSGQQSATADIVEKLRRAIETLQKVRIKLAAIANLK